MKYPINQLGKIIHHPRGAYDGWFVQIEEESEGFFILYMKDPDDPRGESYDDLAITEEEIDRYIGNWKIEWTNKSRPEFADV